jgi:hypothetical protein
MDFIPAFQKRKRYFPSTHAMPYRLISMAEEKNEKSSAAVPRRFVAVDL